MENPRKRSPNRDDIFPKDVISKPVAHYTQLQTALFNANTVRPFDLAQDSPRASVCPYVRYGSKSTLTRFYCRCYDGVL